MGLRVCHGRSQQRHALRRCAGRRVAPRAPRSRPPSQPQRPTPRCRQICAGTTSSCSNFPGGSVHFRPFTLEKISPAPGNRILSFFSKILVGQHRVERGRRIFREIAMQCERNEHRWEAVCRGRGAEPAVKLRYPTHHGFPLPVVSRRALAEQIEFAGHAIGVTPPCDDVDPVVLRRRRMARWYSRPDLTSSESSIRITERRQEVITGGTRKAERRYVADDIAAPPQGTRISETGLRFPSLPHWWPRRAEPGSLA